MTPVDWSAAIDRPHVRAEQHYAAFPYTPPTVPPTVYFDPEDRRMLSPDGDTLLVAFLDVHCVWSPAHTIGKATLDRPNKVTVGSVVPPGWNAADALGKLDPGHEAVFDELRAIAADHHAIAAAVAYPASLNLHRLPVSGGAVLGAGDPDATDRPGVATVACFGGPTRQLPALAVSLNSGGVTTRVPLAPEAYGPHGPWLRSLLP
ncbi:hypothetical protein GCM10009839_46320 [Catenulispora yoronensis]|uniref:Uncharacterized protein n=1 Tax=Catenulispora yoronensis TaxID=450799 RepID=A0ABP5G746_9ACTN